MIEVTGLTDDEIMAMLTPEMLPAIDRDALLALADELEGEGLDGWASGPVNVGEYARRIREALGDR